MSFGVLALAISKYFVTALTMSKKEEEAIDVAPIGFQWLGQKSFRYLIKTVFYDDFPHLFCCCFFFVGDVIQPQIHSVQDLIKMSHKSTGWQSMGKLLKQKLERDARVCQFNDFQKHTWPFCFNYREVFLVPRITRFPGHSKKPISVRPNKKSVCFKIS